MTATTTKPGYWSRVWLEVEKAHKTNPKISGSEAYWIGRDKADGLDLIHKAPVLPPESHLNETYSLVGS